MRNKGRQFQGIPDPSSPGPQPMKAGGGPTTWEDSYDTPTRMHHDAGSQGFQYPLFRPAGALVDGGEARFLESDLIGHPDQIMDQTMTGNSHTSGGGSNDRMETDQKKAYGIPNSHNVFMRWPRQESEESGWERKLDEAHDRDTMWSTNGRDIEHGSLYESIEAQGVKQPVLLHEGDIMKEAGEIQNGHHRLAAANDIDSKMEVPVIYGDFMPGSNYDHSRSDLGF